MDASRVFSIDLLEHIATELNCDVKDVSAAVESFFTPDEEPEVVTPKKKKLPAKTAEKTPTKGKPKAQIKKSSDDGPHTCERIPVRKNGDSSLCGKNAKNHAEIDGETKWYCGTEKSGCYKSILGAIKRNEKTSDPEDDDEESPPPKKSKTPAVKPKVQTKAPVAKGKNLASNKTSSDSKAKSLINSVTSTKALSVKKVKIGEKTIYVDHASRVVIDRSTEEAYGLLAKDNKTIKPLDDKTVRWLEASNIKVRSEKESAKKTALKKKLSKAAPKDESDEDEDELDSLQNDIEDADTGDNEDDIDLGGSDDEEDEDIDLDGSDEEDDE